MSTNVNIVGMFVFVFIQADKAELMQTLERESFGVV